MKSLNQIHQSHRETHSKIVVIDATRKLAEDDFAQRESVRIREIHDSGSLVL